MSRHVVTYTELVKKTRTRKVTLELLPCPLCGGEAEFRVAGNYNPRLNRRMGFKVACKDCKLLTATREGFDGQLRVAELWNRRVRE